MTRDQIQAVVTATVQLPDLARHIVEVCAGTYFGEPVIELLLDETSAEPTGRYAGACAIIFDPNGSEAIAVDHNNRALT